MNNIKIIILMIFTVSIVDAKAQQCATEKAQQERLNNDPNYANLQAVDDIDWQKYANSRIRNASAKMIITPTDTVFEIPIAVHVVHRGDPIGSENNPTDADIIKLIEYINLSFAAKWPSYPDVNSGGVNTRIRFVMAKQDPDCRAINGINRVNGLSIWPKYQNGIDETTNWTPNQVTLPELNNNIGWDRNRYYNIYIVHEIADSTRVNGFSIFPLACPNPGLIIEARVAKVGNPEIIAELGHALDVYHTYEGDGITGCPKNTNCLIDGDKVCDTEPHNRSFISCDGTGKNPCTGQSINYTNTNFMSSSPRVCRDKFTQGQVDRMRHSIRNHHVWNVLLESDADTPPLLGKKVCVSDYSVFDTSSNLTVPAGFSWFNLHEINDVGYMYSSSKKNLYADRSCWEYTKLYQGRSYPINVGLTHLGSQRVHIYIDYNDDGQFQSPQELISSTTSALSSYKDTITIPNANVVTCKFLRLRVMTERTTVPAPDACSNIVYGQVKDYAVYISPESVSTVSITHTAGDIPACPGSPVSFQASVNNALPNYKLFWSLDAKLTSGILARTITNHKNNRQVQAIIVAKNHTCGNDEDTVLSNIIHITHKVQNKAPLITTDGNGMLVSDRYPVDWHESNNGLVASNSYTGFKPTTTGVYFAYNVDTAGCPSLRSNNLFTFPLGVKEYKTSASNIYPNPANTYFNITTTNDDGLIQTVSITNSIGQEIASYNDVGKSLHINTQKWQSGIYIATVKYANGQVDKSKIVVTK